MILSRWMLLMGFVTLVEACAADRMPSSADTIRESCNVVRSVTVIPAFATIHAADTLRVSMPIRDWMTGNGCAGGALLAVRWATTDTAVAVVDALTGLVTARSRGVVSVIGTVMKDSTVRGAMVLQVSP